MMNSLYFKLGALAAAFAGGFWLNGTLWESKWSERDKADALANQKALEEVQNKQKRLTVELEHAYKTAKDLQDKHQVALAAADASAGRMREQLNRIKALPANGDTSTLRISAGAATDRLVLGRVLEESDRLAGVYAAEADRNRITLLNCNAEYNAVRKAAN
jgi:hypothetical protein